MSRGKYRIWWTDEDGRHSKRINGKREDAELFLARMRVGVDGKVASCDYDTYWEIVVRPSFAGLEAHTVYGYERIWRVELAPRIGRKMVCDTTWILVESTLLDIRSPSVQRSAKALWKKVCNFAVRDRLLQHNPVDRNIKLAPLKKRKKVLYEADDVSEWIASIRGIKYEAVLLMELGGGLRHEEAAAMVKENVSRIESDGRVYAALDIERALVVVGGKKILKGTKNGFSERLSVIGEPFASPILDLCEGGSGPVCPGVEDLREGDEYAVEHFASPVTMTHNYKAWCARHDVKHVCPGNLRSAYATLHGEAGSLDSLVSLSMGHSDGTTKGNNYQQATVRGLMMIADSLTDYLAKFAPDSTGNDE